MEEGRTSGELVDEGALLEDVEPLHVRRSSAHRLVVLAGACVGSLCLASLVLWTGGPSDVSNAQGGALRVIDPKALISEFDPLASEAAGLPGMPWGKDEDSSYLATAPASIPPQFQQPWHQPGAPPSGSSGASASPALSSEDQMKLAPKGCAQNEEILGGLCYIKCSEATNGTYPNRMSAYQCCKDDNILVCLLSMNKNAHFKFDFPGQGYDKDGSGNVPHLPGQCLENEENVLNTCYKKCSLLTNSEFPIRSGANTCCKKDPCWNIFNVRSMGVGCDGYGIGGGTGNSSSCPHAPFR